MRVRFSLGVPINKYIGVSFNGRTLDFGSGYEGSTPSTPTILNIGIKFSSFQVNKKVDPKKSADIILREGATIDKVRQ